MNLNKVYSIIKINEIEASLCVFETKYYKITSKGELFNKSGKKLKLNDNCKGYMSFHFTAQSKFSKRLYIHRLVGEAFLEPIDGKTHINHKNGIKNDNRVENLEWCTQKENNRHARKLGLCGPNYNCKVVIQMDMQKKFIRKWNSCVEAARFFGCTKELISQAARKSKLNCLTAKGYLWEYESDKN